MKFLKLTNDANKMYILNNFKVLKALDIKNYDINEIIKFMSEENKKAILENKKFLEQLGLQKYEIVDLITTIEEDEVKKELSRQHELNQYEQIRIIKTFSTENKKKILFKKNEILSKNDIASIIGTFQVDEIIDFIENEKTFLKDNNIKTYEIIRKMKEESQLEIIYKIDEIELSEVEKRKIFAVIDNETSEKINLDKIQDKYKILTTMKKSKEFKNYGKIIPDFESDLSQYKDLDEFMYINPLEIAEEDKLKVLELCKICPNAEIDDWLVIGSSTSEEYIEGEKWIESVLKGINQEWTDVQKLAYIDTMIGKRVSYTPEFGTEVEASTDARALWKIITKGYGVCNGIAQIEKYILSKVGIQSEMVSGTRHAFLKVKDIKIPTEEGNIKGDTLIDPTWNLTSSRYGTLPKHFCKSYEELRKVDIDSDGIDHKCHKNEQLEQENLINIDEKTVRKVYKSVGLADKDGKFPIKELVEKSLKIDQEEKNIKSNINNKFELLKQYCPEFASCQNSTMDILKIVLLKPNEYFKFNRCIASRVYNREDAEKQAVLYVYMESEEFEKQFFYADKEKGEFISLTQEEFEAKFECYESDLSEISDHKRPWETDEIIKVDKAKSSGEIAEGDGR